MNKPVTVFTPAGSEPDEGAITQLNTCLAPDAGVAGVLSADHHLGYSAPIGSSIAYRDAISPSGVGYDIGCGNMAVATSLLYSDISADLPAIMDEIAKRISFGMGRPNNEPADAAVLDKITREAPIPGIRKLQGLAVKQLGTVGGGNHYVDLFREEPTDRVWIGVHFGSRGFGHKIASGFLAMSQSLGFEDRAAETGMMDAPALLDTRGSLGHAYIESMKLAGEYAYAGREAVVAKVLEILSDPAVVKTVHNHHNFAWQEEHFGEKLWVVRKGATPLFPGQEGFIGSSMGEKSVIVEGFDGASYSGTAQGNDALWSAPHGAGRAMSRTAAKGKSNKRWHCNDCGATQEPRTAGWQGACMRCGSQDIKRIWIQETQGKVDWTAAKADLKMKNIQLRGADADEAPLAYKRLPAVLAAHEAYVKVTHQLIPIGVVMAGPGINDPYKD